MEQVQRGLRARGHSTNAYAVSMTAEAVLAAASRVSAAAARRPRSARPLAPTSECIWTHGHGDRPLFLRARVACTAALIERFARLIKAFGGRTSLNVLRTRKCVRASFSYMCAVTVGTDVYSCEVRIHLLTPLGVGNNIHSYIRY